MTIKLIPATNGSRKMGSSYSHPKKPITEVITNGSFEDPKRTAKQLKIMNELYRFVTEVTNDCLWEWDLQNKELFWIDGGHKRVFGYELENALIPQNFWESHLHPDDKVRVLTRLNKIIKAGSDSVWEDEYRFKKANGDYAHVHDRGHIIYDKYEKASRMIGATQDITARKLIENKLAEERQAKHREITEAVLTAQENERAEIGKELHDNLNQILAVIKMYIQLAKKPGKKRGIYLDTSSDYIGFIMEEIRKISKKLVIHDRHVISLFDSIRILLDDLVIIHRMKVKFYKSGIEEKDLTEKLQLTIFRIVQEQFNNILKHANATHATINLIKQGGEIMLLIADDGEGCDVLKEKTGVGIINIKSRAELNGGTVRITSKPGEGYLLKVILPLKAVQE
jgi:PAS domain S-box-containing protein